MPIHLYPPLTEHATPISMRAAPADNQTDWILAFSRAEPNQPNNPSEAVYGDNWPATISGLPLLKRQVNTAISSIKSELAYLKRPITGFNPKVPFTRICVPVSAPSLTNL